MTTEDDERASLERLVSEAAIARLLHLYCHAADGCDLAAIRSLFHHDSFHDHAGRFLGLSHDFGAFALDLFARDIPVTQHSTSNVLIDLAGDADVAKSVCCFLECQRVPAAADAAVLDGHRVGRDEAYWVGGRYFDRLKWRADIWKIASPRAVHDRAQRDDVRDCGYVRPAAMRSMQWAGESV